MSRMRQQQQRYWKQQRQQQQRTLQQSDALKHYKAMLHSMRRDQRELKSLVDHSERNELARNQLIPKYLDYLKDWLQQGYEHQNDILTQCIVWCCDAEVWQPLFELADPAIANPKIAPLHWMSRDLVTFVGDSIYAAAETEHKVEGKLQAPLFALIERLESERWQSLNHVLKARCYKLAGLLKSEQGDWAMALQYWETAHQLYPNIAVKGRIKTAQQQLAQLSPPSQASTSAADSSPDSVTSGDDEPR